MPARAAPAEISFGAFRLCPTQFLLLEGDNPVPIGSRALEILIVLLERPGELVSKQELMARVWPNVFVEPANLTVHISALRRMLRVVSERTGWTSRGTAEHGLPCGRPYGGAVSASGLRYGADAPQRVPCDRTAGIRT